MMVTFVDDQYVVTVNGCVVGRFRLYDDALDAYIELSRTQLAF